MKIVDNARGSTHNVQLKVLDIFKVVRNGEQNRFNAFNEQFATNSNFTDNRALLWHGSGLMNFVSILTHGLKIAPREAPSSGYMFGKGLFCNT